MEAKRDLKQAIKRNDATQAMRILQKNNSLLNKFWLRKSEERGAYTPLGYAVRKGKKEIVACLVSLPDIDVSLGWTATPTSERRTIDSPMYLAIVYDCMEIAAILQKEGATCTKREKGQLGGQYSSFISFVTDRRKQARQETKRKLREETSVREETQRKLREEMRVREETQRKLREEMTVREETERKLREEMRVREETERNRREEEKSERERTYKEEREEAKENSRREIKEWMKQHEFAKLQQWLGESRNELEALIAEGKVPVVGWLQLEEILQGSAETKAKLEAELDENATNHEQIQQQIIALQKEQQNLVNRDNHIRNEIKQTDQILSLASERDSIRMLGKKERDAVAQVELKMNNEYFLGDLEFEDVSTVFSMFDMDAMFSTFKLNVTSNDLEILAQGSVADVQNLMQLELSEAVEMAFKLKLIENKEKGVARHWSSCSICSKSAGVLLREYGMTEDERKQIEEKIKDWKGYFLVMMTAMGIHAVLQIPAGPLRSKLLACLKNIQKLHKWEQD